MKQRTEITSGIIKQIDNINKRLSFVSLIPIENGVIDIKLPFYSEIKGQHCGKYVNFQTTIKGIFSKERKQEIIGSSFKISITLPEYLAEAINEEYRLNH